MYLSEVAGVWDTATTVLTLPSATGDFYSASCVSPGNCEVVGSEQAASSGAIPLVDTEVSGAWASPAAFSASQGELYAVSCASLDSCDSAGSDFRPIVSGESSGTWDSPLELATTDPSGQGQFTSVSCPSDGNCVAVGEDLGTNDNFIASDVNGVWDAPIDGPTATSADHFQSVDCSSVGNCAVVGYVQGVVVTEPVVDDEVDGVWAAPTVVPSSGTTGSFNSVSCTSAGNCVAVGEDESNNEALYVAEVNGSWGVPTDVATPYGQGSLTGISCPSSGNCVAVGADLGDHEPVTLTESDGVWGPPVDQPPTAGPSIVVVHTGNWRFTSVSCPTVDNCLAVGNNGNFSLRSIEVKGRWSTSVIGTGTTSTLESAESVSCASVDNCVVDGVNTATPGESIAFEDAEANGTWLPTILVGGTVGQVSTLDGVSCPRIGACLLVGEDETNQEPQFIAFTTASPVLTISNTARRSPAGTAITLAVTGGSGAVNPTFRVTGTGCSVSGATLRGAGVDVCVVTAAEAANGFYPSTESSPATFDFSLASQARLKVVAKSAHRFMVLTWSGGSGHGTVAFKVSGKGCILRHNQLSAAKGAHCVVTAHKAAQGVYAPATSRPLTISFPK